MANHVCMYVCISVLSVDFKMHWQNLHLICCSFISGIHSDSLGSLNHFFLTFYNINIFVSKQLIEAENAKQIITKY